MKTPRAVISILAIAILGCQSSTISLEDRFSQEDHRWLDTLNEMATDHGYYLRPDYEPKDAPYRTVMTYTRMVTKHDSITYLLAQDRKTKRYSVIVWDLPTPRGWSVEARDIAEAIGDRVGRQNVRMTKAWMERYSSNQTLQPTAQTALFF